MLGFESLQNEVSDFLGVTRKPTKPVIMRVKLDFPKGYEGGVNAFKRYHNSLSTNYELNPFIGITYLPPVKRLNELNDHINIPQNLQEEYTKLYNKYQRLLRYLNVVYIEPNKGNIHQYYAGEYIYGLGQPVSAVFKRVYAEIQRLLELRKLMIAEYYKLINRMTEIDNSERNKPIIGDIAMVIDIKDSDLYHFAASYILSHNAYGRAFSFIEVLHRESDIDNRLLTEPRLKGSINLNEYNEVESTIYKGPDYLQHNLLMLGYRDTLQDLYKNMKVLLFDAYNKTGAFDLTRWVRYVETYFDLKLIEFVTVEGEKEVYVPQAKLCVDLYNLFSNTMSINKFPAEANEYTASCRILTDILLQLGIYGKSSRDNIISCLGLFVAKRREYREYKPKNSWYSNLLESIEFYESEGLKYVFRTVPTYSMDEEGKIVRKKNKGNDDELISNEYNQDVIIIMNDDPSKVRLSNQLVVGDTTNMVKEVKGKRTEYKRYFGDFYYKIDTTEYEAKGWVDNSNSGNLCSITSLISNPRFAKVLADKQIDVAKLVASVLLRCNTYHDQRLFKVDVGKIKEIHKFIQRVTGYNFNVTYYKITKNDTVSKDRLYKRCDFKNNLLEYKIKEKYDVFLANGHAFTVCDNEHLEHIENTVRGDLVVEERPKYNVLESIRYDELVRSYLKDKSQLHDLIGDELGNTKCIPQKYCESISSFETLIGIVTKEYNEIKDKIQCQEAFDYVKRNAMADGCPWVAAIFSRCKTKEDLDKIFCDTDKVSKKMFDMSQSLYSVFDMETHNDDNKRATCYGISYNIFDDENILEEGNMHNLDNNMSGDDLVYEYLGTLVDIMKEREINRIRTFAHNGGKFDTVLLKKACMKLNYKLGELGFKIKCYIEGGGRIKLFSVQLTEEIEEINKRGEKFTKKIHYNIEICDSLVLLESKIAKIGKEYGLVDCSKGYYPYLLYRHAIVDLKKSKMVWSRKELRELCNKYKEEGKVAEYEDIRKFLNNSKNKLEFNLITLFEEYCDQDVKIAAEGLIKANLLYSEIDLSSSGEVNILENRGRGFIVDSNLKVTRPRLLDCVTLSSLAKIIARYYVLSRSSYTYKGIDHEYLSAYTGGLTFINAVQKVESSIINKVLTNPYFYIDNVGRNKALIKYLSSGNYKYDVNKEKKIYDRSKPPAEVIQLRADMETYDKACILLLDANSLYPSAICMMDEFGGFPIGEMKKFTGPPPKDKLWIGYCKINWTKDALAYDEDKFPMHPLIIKTKYGNRHLRPSDTESNYMGMSSVMYKSATTTSATKLYSIELINGVYWDKGSSAFSSLCRVMYDARLKQKKLKNRCLEMCIKKLLNSFYGILLEKCHHESVLFLNRNKRCEETQDVDRNGNVTQLYLNIHPSDKDIHFSKYGGITDYCDLGNFSVATKIELSKIDKYASSVHYGVFVLDTSKYIMNILFDALDWDILYTDTDSAFFTNEQFNKIKKLEINGKKLIDSGLGQFKPDFDDKFKKILEVNKLIPEDSEGLFAPLNPDYGVVSILSIFNNKKGYCNVLLGQAGPVEETYLTVGFQTAYKGVNHQDLDIHQYDEVNRDNNITIDTNATQAIFRQNRKTCDIIINDVGTKPFNKIVRNDRQIAISRIKKKK